MADEDDAETEEQDPPARGTDPSELERVGAKEKSRGIRQGKKEALQALGFESEEDALAFKQALEQADAAKQDEATRLRNEAERAKAEAKAARDEVASERHDLNVERALLRANVPANLTERVARLVDVEVGSDPDEITSAIEDLRKEMPQLFAEPGGDDEDEESSNDETESQERGATNTDPGRGPRQRKKTSARDRALERLEQRHGKRKSSSTS